MLELFCGIGGCAAALAAAQRSAEVVEAVDLDPRALEVYRGNFPHPTRRANLAATSPSWLRHRADLWWLSPPCQPYTRRGRRRDDRDPRARPLLALIELAARARPRYLALENVPGFAGSRSRDLLVGGLERAGFSIRERLLCPTELGVPNRRRRYYLLAARNGERLAPEIPALPPVAAPAEGLPGGLGRTALGALPPPLTGFLDPEPAAGLAVDPAAAARYAGALDTVDPSRRGEVAACFTAAYGRSPVRSGSYLATAGGLRRFSPTEILRLLGFPPGFRLPADLPLASAWRLVGNSLSVPAVQAVLAGIPELAGGLTAALLPPPAPAAAAPGGGRPSAPASR